jgi:hypothetical protein
MKYGIATSFNAPDDQASASQPLQSFSDLQAAKDGGIILFPDYEEDKRRPRRKAKEKDVALKGPV